MGILVLCQKGSGHRYSDFDILIRLGKYFGSAHYSQMQDTFSESDLPDNFKRHIKDDLIHMGISDKWNVSQSL